MLRQPDLGKGCLRRFRVRYLSPMPAHLTDVQMRFGDTDALGHVNNASFASYAELGRLDLVRQFGAAASSLILASLTINFRRQVSFGETISVETWVERIGRSSFTIGQMIYANRELAADSRSVVVYYDYTNGRSLELTPEMREQLASFMSASASAPE